MATATENDPTAGPEAAHGSDFSAEWLAWLGSLISRASSEIAAWPTFAPERPLERLVSACLTGVLVS